MRFRLVFQLNCIKNPLLGMNRIISIFQTKRADERGPLMVAQFHNPTHWCILTRDDGVLEIRSLPSWELHYFCKNFAMSPKVGSSQLFNILLFENPAYRHPRKLFQFACSVNVLKVSDYHYVKVISFSRMEFLL